MLGLDSSEAIPNFTNHEILESNIICNIFMRKLWKVMSKKIEPLRELHVLVRSLKTIDKRPGEDIVGVCKKIIRKLTDYFFMILDLESASFVNGSLFTQLK